MGLTKEDKLWIQNENTSHKDTLKKELEMAMSAKFSATITALQKTIDDLSEENLKMRDKLIQNDIRLDDLEQYGRRMAVRVEGIPWVEHETNADLQNTLVEEFAKVGVEIKKRDIVRLHRSSRPKEFNGSVTKQCIIKFANWRAREKFAGFNKKAREHEKKNKKNKVCRVNNDLTKRRLTLLSDARNRVNALMSRRFTEDQLKTIKDSDNVFCYANINSDLKMRVRGTVLSFNSLAELDNCIAQAFPEAEAED